MGYEQYGDLVCHAWFAEGAGVAVNIGIVDVEEIG
jgi:hypothetical protein